MTSGSHQRKGAVKGSGLGLSIARDCIRRMQGELNIVTDERSGNKQGRLRRNVLRENTARMARKKTCDILTRHSFILLVFPAQGQFDTEANIGTFIRDNV